MFLKNLSVKNFSVITPYKIPRFLNKKVNAGDGFIFDSSIKLIGYNPKHVFSSREELDEEKIKLINSTKLLIVTGANILKDNLEIITGFNTKTLKKIAVPIALMGVGHYGLNKTNRYGFDKDSKNILKEIVTRFPLISVRCNGSYRYVKTFFREITKNILNTSCPVIFRLDNKFKNFKKKNNYNQLVTTITDRSNLKQQLPILHFAKNFFNSNNKILALHQDYENENLETYANNLGYKIFKSSNYMDYINLYKKTDLHFGNRVHAHLKCLSMGIPSFCTPFDLRQFYFSETIGLPLVVDDKDKNLKEFNFDNFILHQSKSKNIMDDFVYEILKIIEK